MHLPNGLSTDHIIELCLLLVSLGAAGGFLSGLLGLGGGVIFVPGLYYVLTATGADADAAIKVAIGTSTALVMVTGGTSAYWHHRHGSVDFTILKKWGPFIVAGVVIGTLLAAHMDGGALKDIFAAASLLISCYMTVSKEPETEAATPVQRIKPRVFNTAGVFIGAVAAMIGIGGAMMTIPAMSYNGTPMRKAVGTGGALGMVIALPAMLLYIWSGLHAAEILPAFCWGYINLLALVFIVPLCVLLSPVGVNVSHNMPRNRLRRIFAIVLVLVSLKMFFAS